MFGWSIAATARASASKRIEIVGPCSGPSPDHLQGDETVEPGLARLVDDPHPALPRTSRIS